MLTCVLLVCICCVLCHSYFLKAFFYQTKFHPLSSMFYLQQKTNDHFLPLHTWESECELWLSRTKLWITGFVETGQGWHDLAWTRWRKLLLHSSEWANDSLRLISYTQSSYLISSIKWKKENTLAQLHHNYTGKNFPSTPIFPLTFPH